MPKVVRIITVFDDGTRLDQTADEFKEVMREVISIKRIEDKLKGLGRRSD